MQKSRGISMISLIVTIICIILLSSMAIGTGIKYVKESKDKKEATFISVLSSAVAKRQEETNVSSLLYPYLGYYIKDQIIFDNIFAQKIKNENVTYSSGIWYVVDTASAASLGVKQPEDYINTIDTSYEGLMKVALVNYATGDVYIVDVTSSEMGNLDISTDNMVTGHTHRFLETEPTCTEPVKCADCGYILKEPLGHLYDAELSTPEAADEKSHFTKVCIRDGCNMKGGYETHKFEYSFKEENDIWYHNISCNICGWEKEEKTECTLRYTLPTVDAEKELYHVITCIECGHSEQERHSDGNEIYRRISESEHELYCTNTNCNHIILREFHVDANNDSKCDDCESNIISYAYPQLANITMINKDAPTDEGKYYAKYGETVRLSFIVDKPIKVPEITIAGQAVNEAHITSSEDKKTWTADLLLEKAFNIPNGNIVFKIMCESEVGVELVLPVTETSNGKYVTFDGDAPIIDYIDKNDVANK